MNRKIIFMIKYGFLRIFLLAFSIFIYFNTGIKGLLFVVVSSLIGLGLVFHETHVLKRKFLSLKFYLSIPTYILYGFNIQVNFIHFVSEKDVSLVFRYVFLTINIIAFLLYLLYDFTKRRKREMNFKI